MKWGKNFKSGGNWLYYIGKLDAELAFSNPPDMLDLTRLDVAKYMEKQVLENVDPYLSESSVLKREDSWDAPVYLPCCRDMAEEKEDGSFEARIRIFIPDNINQYYAGLTGEEVDEVLGIIESANFTLQEGVRKDILNILVEEMSPCLNGDKTYEEAAAIVQNRVQTCLNER